MGYETVSARLEAGQLPRVSTSCHKWRGTRPSVQKRIAALRNGKFFPTVRYTASLYRHFVSRSVADHVASKEEEEAQKGALRKQKPQDNKIKTSALIVQQLLTDIICLGERRHPPAKTIITLSKRRRVPMARRKSRSRNQNQQQPQRPHGDL